MVADLVSTRRAENLKKYPWDQERSGCMLGWKRYRTTRPLVPENVSRRKKKKDDCKNLEEREIQRKNSNQ
jgi:hypothetical protein